MTDSKTTIDDLKEASRKFADERDWDQFHNAKDLAIGIITEASELLEHFRFKSPEESDALFKDPKKREQICDELSDVTYFVMRFAQRYGIDLSDEYLRKSGQSAKKYPIEKVKGQNKKYTEYD